MSSRSVEAILKALGSNFLSLGERGFDYGAQGRLLRRNVESLWFEHCVTMPPYNVFLSKSEKLSETLTSLSASSSDSKPFGIATIEDSKTHWNQSFLPENSAKAFGHAIAKVAVVLDEENAKDMFHRKQRERKVWWRKFARNPSRFALTEARKINKNREVIDITAEFEFGLLALETIVYQHDAKKIYSQQAADEKEDSPGVHTVEHIASLDWGCLAMLCDGFELAGGSGELKIHPKLSPYKAGFYLERFDDEDPKSQEKTRLIHYLNNLLKAKGLETVLTRSKRGIETFHVPLTITVDDASLQNGIVRVTSQLTTIAEAVHVTDLPKYVAARCS